MNFKKDASVQWWVGHAKYEMNMPVLQENLCVWIMLLTKLSQQIQTDHWLLSLFSLSVVLILTWDTWCNYFIYILKLCWKKYWKGVWKYLEHSKNALDLDYTLKFCQLVVPVITIYNHSHSGNGMLCYGKPWLYWTVHAGALKYIEVWLLLFIRLISFVIGKFCRWACINELCYLDTYFGREAVVFQFV